MSKVIRDIPRWLKEDRLQSAGTRTAKLRGRARKITFHVFDPSHIEDVLDRELVTVTAAQRDVGTRSQKAPQMMSKKATRSQ